jgi:hypothetical protein
MHISQAFLQHQVWQIPIVYEAVTNFLFKMDCKFIFLVVFEELLYAATWLKLPKG